MRIVRGGVTRPETDHLHHLNICIRYSTAATHPRTLSWIAIVRLPRFQRASGGTPTSRVSQTAGQHAVHCLNSVDESCNPDSVRHTHVGVTKGTSDHVNRMPSKSTNEGSSRARWKRSLVDWKCKSVNTTRYMSRDQPRGSERGSIPWIDLSVRVPIGSGPVIFTPEYAASSSVLRR